MRRAIIIVTVVILVVVGTIVGLTIWHNRICGEKLRKAGELESTIRDELLKKLTEVERNTESDKIYASPDFDGVIKLYDEIVRECRTNSETARISLERIKKARENAVALLRAEEEERKIAAELGIDYAYLKNFPEGARLTYYYGEGGEEKIDFNQYICAKYSDSLHGEYQDVFRIDFKTPLKEGPADYFITTGLVIPAGIEKNKYINAGILKQGDSPAKNQMYLKLFLPEYISYKGKKIFFKMNDLLSQSGHIVVLDPLEAEDGDRVKLLARDLVVVKEPDQSSGGRVSLEINIVCHSVLK